MTSTAALAGMAAAAAILAAGDVATLAGVRRRARAPRRPTRVLPGLLTWLARRGVSGPAGDLDALLAAAGAPRWLGTGEAMAAKSALAGAAALVALGLGSALPGRVGLLVVVVAPACGFLLPDLVLRRRARARARTARAEAPDLLDRVRLASDAGLPPAAALARAARHDDGPLATELRALAAATALGAPREQALHRLTARLPVPEARALAAAVRRSERHGAPRRRSSSWWRSCWCPRSCCSSAPACSPACADEPASNPPTTPHDRRIPLGRKLTDAATTVADGRMAAGPAFRLEIVPPPKQAAEQGFRTVGRPL